NKTTKQNITGEVYFPERPAPADSTDGITVAIVDRTPKKDPRMLSHTYAMSIYAAKENVRIVNPYFVPTSSIRKALNHA
ncbi:cardiolipin synthase, partial [Escherichia coli]|nr:cardiolipin synthase [Escherichia coli]